MRIYFDIMDSSRTNDIIVRNQLLSNSLIRLDFGLVPHVCRHHDTITITKSIRDGAFP